MTETRSEIEARRLEARQGTIAAIKRQMTPMARWKGLHEVSADPLWIARAEAAVALIPPSRNVLDIGCNDMMVERLLPPGHRYIPLDVAKRDDRTIVIDLNKCDLPQLDANFVLGLGLLEYFFNIPRFLEGLAAHYNEGLFSYHPFERSPGKDRLAVGWVNSLTSYDLVALFRSVGFAKVEIVEYKPSLHFFRISK